MSTFSAGPPAAVPRVIRGAFRGSGGYGTIRTRTAVAAAAGPRDSMILAGMQVSQEVVRDGHKN